MEKSNIIKVSLIAVDEPSHRQVYIYGKENKSLIFKDLLEMSFTTSGDSICVCYNYLSFVGNIDEKRFFAPRSTGKIAFAIQKIAILIDYY